MGNRAYLTIGECCRFDANNVLPVTWLAPFDVADRVTEHRKDRGDEWYAHLFKVSRDTAIDRLDWAISKAAPPDDSPVNRGRHELGPQLATSAACVR